MFEKLIFILFAVPAVVAGVAILLSTNIVRMAFWLITMLIAVAGLYFLMGAYLLGAIQILVYVGGVAVLLVFGVMLTSRHVTAKSAAGTPRDSLADRRQLGSFAWSCAERHACGLAPGTYCCRQFPGRDRPQSDGGVPGPLRVALGLVAGGSVGSRLFGPAEGARPSRSRGTHDLRRDEGGTA